VLSLRRLLLLGLAGLASAVAAYLLVSYFKLAHQEDAIAVHGEVIYRSPSSFAAFF
jgi:hypothetical protein